VARAEAVRGKCKFDDDYIIRKQQHHISLVHCPTFHEATTAEHVTAAMEEREIDDRDVTDDSLSMKDEERGFRGTPVTPGRGRWRRRWRMIQNWYSLFQDWAGSCN
jgi:hypothetical protein